VNDDVPIIVETLSRPFFPMVRLLFLRLFGFWRTFGEAVECPLGRVRSTGRSGLMENTEA
jgi:hypothetical protein